MFQWINDHMEAVTLTCVGVLFLLLIVYGIISYMQQPIVSSLCMMRGSTVYLDSCVTMTPTKEAK